MSARRSLTSVYVARGANGRVLYVGITGVGTRRMHVHAKASKWWPRAASIELIHLPTRREAEVLEASLIRELVAEFNVKHGVRVREEPGVPAGLLDLDGLRGMGLPPGAARSVFRALPKVRRGRRHYVRRSDFNAYVREHTREADAS